MEKVEEIQEKKYIFLDYSHDKRFKNSADYFMDDDHLNEKRSRAFYRNFIEYIEKELKDEGKI